MSTDQYAAMMTPLPHSFRLGPAHLTVTDLERSLAYYQGPLGLDLNWREGDRAGLGVGGDDVLLLTADRDARPAGRHAGLYHVAILYPSRRDLAQALLRVAVARTPISGASDHGTHDAIYLPDPDGNGLELAADNPREQWPDFSDTYALGPKPLDLQGLLADAGSQTPEPRAAAGTVVGHVHLHVGDLERALAFYGDVIGFELQVRLPSALFVSANGYHHHLGLNTWRGTGVSGPPPGTVGLREWTIETGDPAATAQIAERARAAGYAAEAEERGTVVADPWGIKLLLV